MVFSYNPFKRNSTFNRFKNDAAIEVYMSMLEVQIMTISKQNTLGNFDNLNRGKGRLLKSWVRIKVLSLKGQIRVLSWFGIRQTLNLKEANSQLNEGNFYEKLATDRPTALS